ncbi:MAG TPA: APC family permease [Candidatus Acidoferrales bacterium]|nr:APC family permease [Candidatus Acidoferrales bacterium]
MSIDKPNDKTPAAKTRGETQTPATIASDKSHAVQARGAIRQIGFLPLLAVFYGYTCGGPFGYEQIFKSSGPGMAVLFLALVPFFWSIPISLASAELNSIMPVQGGFYRWSRAAFGDFWGFQCGWWNWSGTFLLNSLYGVLLMDYLADYIPWLTGYTKWAGACVILLLLAYINARGIKLAGWLAVVLQAAVFVPVIWLCVVALFHWHHNPLIPFVPPGKPLGNVFGAGLALAMWNYAGYEQLSSVTGEMKDPQRTFMRLIVWNTPMTILTYILPATLAIAVLGNWQQWETGYIVTASRMVGGESLGVAMLVASIIGTLALSNSTILYTTRIPATMAEDGFLPAWLGKIHPRFGTPARAIAISAVVYCVLAKFDVVDLVDIYIWTRIATSLLTLVAAWRMRQKAPDAPRRFRIPGGRIGVAAIIILPAILCAVKIWYSEPFVMRYSPLLLATGPVAYLILRFVFHLTPRPAKYVIASED